MNFYLRKPLEGLDVFCNVFNQLITDGAKCSIQLQDITEENTTFSYVSISFSFYGQIFLTFNRDLVGTITADNLLDVMLLNRDLQHAIPYFESCNSQTLTVYTKNFDKYHNLSDNIFEKNSSFSTETFLLTSFKLLYPIPKLTECSILANMIIRQNGMCNINFKYDDNMVFLVIKALLCHPNRPSLELILPLDFNEVKQIIKNNPLNMSMINIASVNKIPVKIAFDISLNSIYLGIPENSKILEKLFKDIKLH